jgi:alpha-1,2-mannosyltransferase
MAANPNVQTLRFRRPTNNEETKTAEEKKPKLRHAGILQDQIRRYEDWDVRPPPSNTSRRHERTPWNPGYSVAVRILLLVRFCAAMYSNISDCDEGAWGSCFGVVAH